MFIGANTQAKVIERDLLPAHHANVPEIQQRRVSGVIVSIRRLRIRLYLQCRSPSTACAAGWP